MNLIRMLQAAYHGGKIILTGTGVAPHVGGHVTVTGTGVEWALVSQAPPIKMAQSVYKCQCPTYGPGYVYVPKPAYPTKAFAAKWDGARLTVTWTSAYSYSGDEYIGISDLTRFAVDYIHGVWTISDFALFSELYHRPSIYTWTYRLSGGLT